MLKSHKNPDKDLFEHLADVYIGMLNIFSALKLNPGFIDDVKYELYAKVIGYCHDIGKATLFFQEKLELEKDTRLANHSKIGAVFSVFVSSQLGLKEDESFLIYRLIYCHHAGQHKNLSQLKLNQENINDIKEQLDDILKNGESKELLIKVLKCFGIFSFSREDFEILLESINKKITRMEIDASINPSFKESDRKKLSLYFILYSAFSKSDKFNALFRAPFPFVKADTNEEQDILKEKERRKKLAGILKGNLVDYYLERQRLQKPEKFKDSTLNRLRQEFYLDINRKVENVNLDEDRIYQIIAPTGIGKTLTILNAAIKLKARLLKERNAVYRIIYSLPYLSIIDQTAIIIKDIFNCSNIEPKTDLFLEYHHLADTLTYKKTDEETTYEDHEGLIFNKFWDSEIILTTFVSLLEAFSSGESLLKLSNIANSIILLDEVQSVDAGLFKFLNWFFRILTEYFNCYIILTTATMPKIFEKNEFKNFYFSDSLQLKLYEKSNRYKIINIGDKTINELIEYLKTYIRENPEESILIVANTKKMAYQISKRLLDDGYNENIIHLTTHTIPIKRKNLIRKIKDEKHKTKIIVSTQLIEAGVDISVNTVFKFLSPFESVVQAAGRANRNYEWGEGKGKLFLVNVLTEDGKPSYEPVYLRNSKRTAGDLKIGITRDLLKNDIEERDILSICTRYFDSLKLGNFWNEIKKDLATGDLKDFGEKIQIINDELGQFTVFIDIEVEDESDGKKKTIKSKDIYKKYQGIKKMQISKREDYYSRKIELQKFRSEFSQFCVSITKADVKKIPEIGDIDGINEIPMLSDSYDVRLGIKMFEEVDRFL